MLLCTASACDAIDSCHVCPSSKICLECDDGYTKLTLKDESGSDYNLCTYAWEYNSVGCKQTEPNCQVCHYDQIGNSHECKQCKPDYYLDQLDGSKCKARSGSLILDFFVSAFSGLTLDDFQKDKANSAVGSISDPFFFVQEAIFEVLHQRNVERYNSVRANIWLGEGSHFFFQCYDNQEDFCEKLPRLQAVYPTTDNVEFAFSPIFCEFLTDPSPPEVFRSLSSSQISEIQSMCTYRNPVLNKQDTPPVRIYVNDNHSYFNITRSMTFDSIEFRGENALAQPTDIAKPVNTKPCKLCEVLAADEAAITGEYTRIPLKKTDISDDYKCEDSGFQDVSIPMSDEEMCDDSSAATINVNRFKNRCKFEPYREEFFTRKNDVYYLRQQTLFNIYGFSSDQQSSQSKNKAPSLTLTNCKFKFFLADYDSLINIETDNFVAQTQEGVDKPILSKLGNERGARIYIFKSQFAHSRFCKGLIAFKANPPIDPLLLNNLYFVADFQAPAPTYFAGFEPTILLEKSTFMNLNYGVATQYLSVADVGTLTMYGFPKVPYEPFDNLGIVLNLQGYPGGIELKNNTMVNNLVFIPDIFPSLRTKEYDFENSVQGSISELATFKDEKLAQFSLKTCVKGRYKRLFSDYLTSFKDHPDQLLVQLERQSLIYVSKPEMPVIIHGNNFTENLGIFGGAIFVDSPNMKGKREAESPVARLRPLILIGENQFHRNSAYSSGNAIYLRATRPHEPEEVSLDHTCGGFYIFSNDFTNNTAVTKSHNGGAITLACDSVDPSDSRYLDSTSTVQGTQANRTMQVSFYLTKEQQTVYRTASGIVRNNFTNNTSSLKGLAIYSRHMQNLFVLENNFTYNQPHLTFHEDVYDSVYFWLLAKRTRHVSFFDETRKPFNFCKTSKVKRVLNGDDYCQADDEFGYFEYFATSLENGGLLDWHQVQGTVHIEGCSSCLVSYNMADSGCRHCNLLPQTIEVRNNLFDRNQGGLTFYKEAKLPRASQIFINGVPGTTSISGNRFVNMTQHFGREFFNMIEANLTSYFVAMFAGYWELPQTPLIHVSVLNGINERLNSTIYKTSTSLVPWNSTDDRLLSPLSELVFAENNIKALSSVQPLVHAYKGSILNFESASIHSQVRVNSNFVKDCKIIGKDAALFFVSGGGLSASNNNFEEIGTLSNLTFTQPFTRFFDPNTLAFAEPMQYASYYAYPYQPGSITNLTMERGIFLTEAGPINSTNWTQPIRYEFSKNHFNKLFCHQGCVLGQVIKAKSHPTLLRFSDNVYQNIKGLQGGVQLVTEEEHDWMGVFNQTYSIQILERENVSNVQNGAFVLHSSQVYVLFRNCTFTDAFAGAITMNGGSALVCTNCTFSHSQRNNSTSNSTDLFTSSFGTQIKLQNVLSDGKIDSVLRNFTLKISSSVIEDSRFLNITSAVPIFALENSNLTVLRTNFTQNHVYERTGASLIETSRASLTIKETRFLANLADVGGCLKATDLSTVRISESSFVKNTAYQSAGVLYAANESKVNISLSEFLENVSRQEGSVIVLQDIQANQALLIKSAFAKNMAGSSLIVLRNAEMEVNSCNFTDNYAHTMSHGFTLYSSKLLARSVQITQSHDEQNGAISGAFYLTAGSQLELVEGSAIKQTTGRTASAVYVEDDSIFVTTNSTFADIKTRDAVMDQNAGVIVGSHAKSISVSQTLFEKCDRLGILAIKTDVTVISTRFQQSLRGSYINVRFAQLTAQANVFQTGVDPLALGRAINCFGCHGVDIIENKFTELQGMRGAAIYLDSSRDVSIRYNTFKNNTAEQGGAIFILHSDVVLKGNNITDNQALTNGDPRTVTQQHEGAGGAVFFGCIDDDADPDSFYRPLPQFDKNGNHIGSLSYSKLSCKLDAASNNFERNFAEAKAGAIMWTTVNFTESLPNYYVNNTSPNGQSVASPASTIIVGKWGSRRMLHEQTKVVASGQETPIELQLYDAEGKIAKDDNTSVAYLEFETTPSYGSLKGNQVVAQNGIFNFTSFLVTMQPGESAVLNLKILNLDTYGNPVNFTDTPIRLDIYARPCTFGEMLTPDRQCLPCEQGKFSLLQNITTPTSCKPCPPQAFCYGGSVMTPKQGYVRVQDQSVIFLRCLNEQACLLPKQDESLGKCDDDKGYSGYLCAECKPGFWRRDTFFECFKCSNSVILKILWVLAILLMIAIMIWIISVFRRNFDEKQHITIPIVRMMISYLHLYSILSSLETFGGSSQAKFFLQLINIRAVIMTPVEAIFDLQCTDFSNMTAAQKYYFLMIFQSLLPVIIFVVCLLSHLGITQVKKSLAMHKDSLNRLNAQTWYVTKLNTYLSTCILLYVVYPNMVMQLLGSVHCFAGLNEQDQVVYRLRNHPDIFCSDSDYQWYRGFVFIPAIIVWVVCFPFFVIHNFFARKYHVFISQKQDQVERLEVKAQREADLAKAWYGFLYVGLKTNPPVKLSQKAQAAGLKKQNDDDEFEQTKPDCSKRFARAINQIPATLPVAMDVIKGKGVDIERSTSISVTSFFYWEICVFLGKLSLIIVAVAFTDINSNIQMNMALIILAVMLFVQMKSKPYDIDVLNNMHVALLKTILFVTYTRSVLKGIKTSYAEWYDNQQARGLVPVSEQLGIVSRLFEYEPNDLYNVYNALIVIVIILTFYIDLYFLYELYLQALLFAYSQNKKRRSMLYQLLTFQSVWIQSKVATMHQREQQQSSTEESESNFASESSRSDTPSAVGGNGESDISASLNASTPREVQDKIREQKEFERSLGVKTKQFGRSSIVKDQKAEFTLEEEEKEVRDISFDQDKKPIRLQKRSFAASSNTETTESQQKLIKISAFEPKQLRTQKGNLTSQGSDSEPVQPANVPQVIETDSSDNIADPVQFKLIQEVFYPMKEQENDISSEKAPYDGRNNLWIQNHDKSISIVKMSEQIPAKPNQPKGIFKRRQADDSPTDRKAKPKTTALHLMIGKKQ